MHVHPVDVQLLGGHEALNWKMRSILVEWLWEVATSFKMRARTFFSAVYILDRFFIISSTPVARSKLQLVGIAALVVAAKLEEIELPELKDFAYIADNAYTVAEIVAFEMNFVVTLDWNVRAAPMTIKSKNQHAAVLMAVDGCLNLPINPLKSQSFMKGISKRLQGSRARAVATRNAKYRHDPLGVLYDVKIDFKKMNAFYAEGSSLE